MPSPQLHICCTKQNAMKPKTETINHSSKTETVNDHREQNSTSSILVSNASGVLDVKRNVRDHKNSFRSLKMILHFLTNGDLTEYQFYY
jgi:hypothetical protein